MNARRSPTGAKPGAESAEVRKARNGGGSRAVGECGRSAEEVRKLSVPLSSLPSAHPEAGPAAAPPLALVRTRAKKPREGLPAQPPAARADGWPADAPASLARDLPAPELAVIDAALAILARRVREPGAVVSNPGTARELVRLHLAQCERERFGVLFLDSQNAVIGFEVLFEGTLTQTSVYPREVVRRALQLNAGAVILAHNHPSGVAAPSRADECLTQSLRAALQIVDVRVLDHLVIGWPEVTSMAERGLMEPAPAAYSRAPDRARAVV
jgi:DNA repair protein RadC